MRRWLTLSLSLLVAGASMAQTPKAVLRSVLSGDLHKSVEKFDKISDKTRQNMPEACTFAEAVLLNMVGQSGEDKVRGYEMFVSNIDGIYRSDEVSKMFKGLDVSFEDMVRHIENSSCDYIIALDDERSYVLYLNTASRGAHSRLAELEEHLEGCRYRNALGGRSIEECAYFLSIYPESRYYADVASHLALLRYEEAMMSSSEEVMELFIADYSDYADVAKVASRLMQHRYERIFSGDSLEDMKWFVEQYPDHEDMDAMKQTMANIEFPMLQSTCEALEAFIAYYPYVSQIAEARHKLLKASIAENGRVEDFVEYIRANGYDSFYPQMLRYLYAKTGRYIITPDIADVTLLHFVNEEGLAGYMDFEGNVVIEPRYSAERTEIGDALYNAFMLSEFTSYRNLAVAKLDGRWGVIDSEGNTIVPHNYQMVTIYNDGIYAVADTSLSYSELCSDEMCGEVGYYCDVYDFGGKLLVSNKGTYFGDASSQLGYREFVTHDGKSVGTFITPKYGMSYKSGSNQLVALNGEMTPVDWYTSEGVTDNIVVINLNENGMRGRYFVDLDTFQAIKECRWVQVYPMSMGRALVYDGSKYGFIDENLELVIPCKYDIGYARCFDCGIFPVTEGNGYFFIDTNGEVVSQAFDLIYDTQGRAGMSLNLPGIFVLKNETESSYKIIDASGHLLAEVESECVPTIVGNYAIDSSGNRHMFDLSVD